MSRTMAKILAGFTVFQYTRLGGTLPRLTEPVLIDVESKIKSAVSLLVDASHPRKIILFGSQARHEATENSDIDLMVIVEKLKNKEAETMALYRSLWEEKIYADVILVSLEHFDFWKDTTNHICNEAFIDGQILYDKTAS